MTSKKTVTVHWNKLKEEMVQLMDTKIRNHVPMKYNDLNKTFQSKLQRWSNLMSPEGRWLAEQPNKEQVEKMLCQLEGLSLKEVVCEEHKTSATAIPALASGIAGILAGTVLGLSLPISIAGGAVLFGCVLVTMNNKKQKNQEKQIQKVKEAYIAQIIQYGELILSIWEE